MATYVFENIDNQLYARFKQFADSLGVGFQVIDNAEKIKPSQSADSTKPTNLTEALPPLRPLPPFNQAIAEMPRGDDNEDVFVRDYPQHYQSRELE